jgi:mono/diheme cytochrome c family protein
MAGRGSHIAAAALAALLAAGCEWDGRDETALPSTPATRAAAGESLFLAYCSSCHGSGAQGDGPAAGALALPPADLTRIAARRGGEFPAPEIAAFIDGRTRVAAHGSRDMPVWGRRFDDRNQSLLADETLLSPGQILTVVEYLRSLQRPAASE